MSRPEDTATLTNGTSASTIFSREIPAALEAYQQYHSHSIADRESYWREQAQNLQWVRPFSSVVEESFFDAYSCWFRDGMLSPVQNALDRSIAAGRADAPALLHFAADGRERSFTYAELRREVGLVAAGLAPLGLEPGERVVLCLPDGPEAVIFALACSQLGLVYVPVPGSHPVELVRRIIENSGASLAVVSGGGLPAREALSAAAVQLLGAGRVISACEPPFPGTRSYGELKEQGAAHPVPDPRAVDAESPLFLLYPGVGTGIPRGSVFAAGGYLVQVRASYEQIFGAAGGGTPLPLLSTVSLASVAGQAYGLWGPLLCGGCIVQTEQGDLADRSRLTELLVRCEELMLLCTPRLLHGLKREMGSEPLPEGRRFERIASCYDVLAPRLVQFAGNALTRGPVQVLDLWVQSSAGVALICSYPRPELNRTGALGLAAPGVEPAVLNEAGAPCRPNEGGQLVFSSSWPSMVRTLWGQQERYRELYFSRFPGSFISNDGVRVDRDGFYWFMGRLDDLLKVDGRSLATSEVESVLAAHPQVAEAAVVGVAGEEGSRIVAFLVARGGETGEARQAAASQGQEAEPALERELAEHLRQRLGDFAMPSRYLFVRELPRTRSGKVVRRVLRRFATGDVSKDEDWGSVANPGSLEELVRKGQ